MAKRSHEVSMGHGATMFLVETLLERLERLNITILPFNIVPFEQGLTQSQQSIRCGLRQSVSIHRTSTHEIYGTSVDAGG